MDKDELNNWAKAGKIAAEALEFSASLVREGARLIDISNSIEEFITKKGAGTAFPVNLSLNNIAAHYTAVPNDETTLKKSSILKVDIGVECEGCIGDTAATFEVSTRNNEKLISASREARDNAIKIIRAGVKLCEIGKVIETTIKSYGFLPVKNLSGHGLGKYTIHSPPTIPNYDDGDETQLKEGQVVAIEPFATTGSGFIKEGKPSTIYRLINTQSNTIRNKDERLLLGYIKEEFKTLPFSELMLTKLIKKKAPNYFISLKIILPAWKKKGILMEYNQLPEERQDALVSQAEHTILVEKDRARILTKAD